MTKETRTVEQTIFKAEDGTIFFDELQELIKFYITQTDLTY